MRELALGLVDWHDRAVVINLVGARARDGEHVREDIGLRGEKTSVDTEWDVAVSDEDEVAVIQPEFGMGSDTRKEPR